jgi:hypothetical protein
MTDDSLYMGYRNGSPQDTSDAALSPSTAKLFREDPQKYYLRKIKRIDEPKSVPLVVGGAAHNALETFLAWRHDGFEVAADKGLDALRDNTLSQWGEVEEQCVKVNPDNPANPRGREKIELTAEEMFERLSGIFYGAFANIEDFGSPVYEAQRNYDSLERGVGHLAKERGEPTAQIVSYDPETEDYGPMPVGVIGGVPIRGRIDCVGNWPDGSKAIIDHKCVSKVVPWYPYGNTWKSFDPSYDPADSLQLDMYAYATGIPRAGFQFITRRPQHDPHGQKLHPDWTDDRDWDGTGLPAVFAERDQDLHYVSVWRPQPDDHDSRPDDYTLQAIEDRVHDRVRATAEALTESVILLDEGTDPTIAFPAGDPEVIGTKACPYCFYQEEGHCEVPRDTDGAEQDYREAVEKREEACRSSDAIMGRRKDWSDLTLDVFAPDR